MSAGYEIHITVHTTYPCPLVVWEINIGSPRNINSKIRIPIRYSVFIYSASVVLFAFTCTKNYELVKQDYYYYYYYYWWWWWWWWYNIDIQFPIELTEIGISISVRMEYRR